MKARVGVSRLYTHIQGVEGVVVGGGFVCCVVLCVMLCTLCGTLCYVVYTMWYFVAI